MARQKAAGSALDRAILAISPAWGLNRIRARFIAELVARHYEGASVGRRTDGWTRNVGDANAVARPALATLRGHARDLVRNNSWARRGLKTISNNTVGWGIRPKAIGAGADRISEVWKTWAETTACDADGRLNFYGLQALAMRSVAEAGEVLIRRRWRRAEDGLPVPLQLQVLEPDFIDINKDGIVNQDNGNPVIQGVEFDKLGRRVAYWLYGQHPGSNRIAIVRGGAFVSNRVSADDIIHVYDVERAGQVRGITWFSPAIVKLKDFDEYEDATLMRQKIAACFAAFVTDVDGTANPLGAPDDQTPKDPLVEMLEPGLVSYLKPGQEVAFGTPPIAGDDGFSTRTLRYVAAGLGVTYEDLTGDYSQVNFSSARMARLAHWANVHGWRWNMLIPQLCDPAWAWLMEAAIVAGLIEQPLEAKWTPPPMPMIEPDKEGLAIARLVRTGAMTHDEMVREQGDDPEEHWQEYSAGLKRLDALGIVLDSDVRKVSQAGLTQERVGGGGGGGGSASGNDSGSGQ